MVAVLGVELRDGERTFGIQRHVLGNLERQGIQHRLVLNWQAKVGQFRPCGPNGNVANTPGDADGSRI